MSARATARGLEQRATIVELTGPDICCSSQWDSVVSVESFLKDNGNLSVFLSEGGKRSQIYVIQN